MALAYYYWHKKFASDQIIIKTDANNGKINRKDGLNNQHFFRPIQLLVQRFGIQFQPIIGGLSLDRLC